VKLARRYSRLKGRGNVSPDPLAGCNRYADLARGRNLLRQWNKGTELGDGIDSADTHFRPLPGDCGARRVRARPARCRSSPGRGRFPR